MPQRPPPEPGYCPDLVSLPRHPSRAEGRATSPRATGESLLGDRCVTTSSESGVSPVTFRHVPAAKSQQTASNPPAEPPRARGLSSPSAARGGGARRSLHFIQPRRQLQQRPDAEDHHLGQPA